MLDFDTPMPYDADDVVYDISFTETIDYSISFDIHSEGKCQSVRVFVDKCNFTDANTALISSTNEMRIE